LKWGGRWQKAGSGKLWRRRPLIEVGRDRQVVRQYWTQLSGDQAEEFLAVEYVYTRQR